MSPVPTQQRSRINLVELKLHISTKLGPERARRYFSCLNRFLGQKLSKSEFDKLCFVVLGKENIHLNNQLICSIFKNAQQAKVVPLPAVHVKDPAKLVQTAGNNSSSVVDTSHPVGSNGVDLPQSSRKSRSGVRDRKLTDVPIPLGPNGRIDVTTHQSLPLPELSTSRENGSLIPCDLKRPLQQNLEGIAEQPTKRPRVEKPLPHDRISVHSVDPVDIVAVKDGKQMGHKDDAYFGRGPLEAPLGIPFCPASVGGTRKSLPLTVNASSYWCAGELCQTVILKKRMECIAEAQGLGGVTKDCADLLNNGLDVYLKRLIKSSIELAGARSGHEPIRKQVHKQQPYAKIVNGMRAGDHMHIQGHGGPLEDLQQHKNHYPVSLLDFKVAMELNRQLLGEDWPSLQEKICFHPFDE